MSLARATGPVAALGYAVALVLAGQDGPAGAPVAPGERSPARTSSERALELVLLQGHVEQHPEDAPARHSLGIALLAAGRREEAIAQLERAVALDPLGVDALRDLAAAYADVSRYDEAERAYARILERLPDDPLSWYSLAHISFRQGDFEKAIERDRRAIAADPGYVYATHHLALVLRFAGRDAEAEAEWNKVLRMTPADELERLARIDTLYRIATVLLDRDAYAEAERLLAEVVREAPTHAPAHYARARALRALGRTDEAARAVESHLQLVSQQEPTGAVASGP